MVTEAILLSAKSKLLNFFMLDWRNISKGTRKSNYIMIVREIFH
jgi:hypothetical protein